MKPPGLKLVASGIYEDVEGAPWVLNEQRGWVRVSRSARSVIAARTIRTLVRNRGRAPELVARIVRRLDGATGWWASAAIRRGY